LNLFLLLLSLFRLLQLFYFDTKFLHGVLKSLCYLFSSNFRIPLPSSHFAFACSVNVLHLLSSSMTCFLSLYNTHVWIVLE
jgi:hypothetical protein